MHGEQLLDGIPPSALADHSRTEVTVTGATAPGVADRVHHALVPQREGVDQALLEDRADFEWEAQEDLERVLDTGARLFYNAWFVCGLGILNL